MSAVNWCQFIFYIRLIVPDVSRTLVTLVVTPGMGYRQGLLNSTDGLAGLGFQQQVEMVRHQAVAEEKKRTPRLGSGKRIQERSVVGIIREDVATVVASIKGMINETVVNNSWQASHGK